VELVLIAPRAILLPLDPLRMQPAVLIGEVIAILTIRALENDLFARHSEAGKRGSGDAGMKY
jgi:hypothetical protein